MRRDDRRPIPRNDRRRSISPSGRSPPYKRHRRDDMYDDRYGRDRYDRRMQDGYDRDGNYREHVDFDMPRHGRGDFRDYGNRGPQKDKGPMSFKEFMMTLPDNTTPQEAQRLHKLHLQEWYGNEEKAEFEQRKNDEEVKLRFDPRRHEDRIKQRDESARREADNFAQDFKSGMYDYTAESFNQGEPVASAMDVDNEDKEQAEKDKPPNPKTVPAVWELSVLATDYATCKTLALKLDKEKDIKSNPLLGEEDADMDDQSEDPYSELVQTYTSEVSEAEQAEVAGKLDQFASYLWRVHRIDYYAGNDDSLKDSAGQSRMIRCDQPTDPDYESQESKAQLQEHGKVQSRWQERLTQPDPELQPQWREEIDKKLEAFVDSCVKKISEGKWGSTLSSKMFVERKFVLKHIRSKHSVVVKQREEELLDELFYENYKKQRQAQKEAEGPENRVEVDQEYDYPHMGHVAMRGRMGFGMRGRRGMGRGMPPGMMPPGMMPMMPHHGMVPMFPGMRMRMRGGGRGGGGRGGMGREYFDLDDPSNK